MPAGYCDDIAENITGRIVTRPDIEIRKLEEGCSWWLRAAAVMAAAAVSAVAVVRFVRNRATKN